jgi:hypothetical protein
MVVSSSLIPTEEIDWSPSWRIIPTKYPPIGFFEDLDLDPSDCEAVMEIENIHLIAEEDRITGPGMGRVMPCFTILDSVSNRFNNHEFGAYYAAKDFETAVWETVYHREQFFTASDMKPQDVDNVILNADIMALMHDIRGLVVTHSGLYDPVDYNQAQAFARDVREQNSMGIIYQSVRHAEGECVAALRPRPIQRCRDVGILAYKWDGRKIIGHYKKGDYKPL